MGGWDFELVGFLVTVLILELGIVDLFGFR